MKRKLAIIVITFALGSLSFFLLPVKENHKSVYVPRTELNKATGWQGAAEAIAKLRNNPNTATVSYAEWNDAYEGVKAMRNQRGTLGMEWDQIGPANQGGRTRAILVDKNDPTGNTVFAGGVTGGLWKSTDAAGTWTPVNDLAPNLVVSCIAQGPDGTIYVGTGCDYDGYANAPALFWPGKGIYKSTDGVTFSLISSTIPPDNTNGDVWSSVQRIAVDPNNSSRICAATHRGLQISTDGGNTWDNPVFTDYPSCNIPANGLGGDVVILDNGTIIAVVGGTTFRSTSGNSCTFEKLINYGLPTAGRIVLREAPSDNSVVWAVSANSSSADLKGIYKSTDYGANWTKVLGKITDYFGPLCSSANCQGIYDLALGVSPVNSNSIIIGGVELWKWDGNLTRIAWEFGGYPYYVHSDKHYIYYDPTDQTGNTVYFGTDGGIFKSIDGAETFLEANRNYITTQFYSVSFFAADYNTANAGLYNYGFPFGGTQDNGTILVPMQVISSANVNTDQDGIGILGGDGFDSDASQISAAMFATIYNGCLYRANSAEGSNLSFADIGPSCGNPANPFWTVAKLWESLNDTLSQDTIVFAPDTNDIGIGSGNDFQKTFTGTLPLTQTSAIIVNGSVSFTAGLQIVDDFDGDGQLTGDGSGSINYSTGDYTVNFISAPTLNTIIYAHFAERFNAGAEVILTSNTAGIPVHYTTLGPVYPGDVVYVKDPVQSMIALAASETQNGSPSVLVARKAIDFSSTPEWWNVAGSGASVNAMEFSKDGNHLFIAGGSSIRRISGLSYLYKQSDIPIVTTTTTIANFSPQEVTGIAVDQNNPENLVVTLGGFGLTDYVYLIDNAVSAGTNAGNKISKQSNLTPMPVYDCEIDVLDQNRVVLGTEFGVFACNDFSNAAPTWSDESDPTFAYVPTYDVRQQRTPWNEADNHEVYYLGTFGRGMWQSGTFVGVNEQKPVSSNEVISDLNIYPNPMHGEGTISFKSMANESGSIGIYDIDGKVVKTLTKSNFNKGINKINININKLGTGTYFIMVKTNTINKVARFINVK